MASPLAGGASGIVRQQFGGIGAERGGESQQIPHIWLVAPGEPVGHGHLVLVATTKSVDADNDSCRSATACNCDCYGPMSSSAP